MEQPSLFPEIEPFENGFLPVSELHTLYYEQVGNPNGKPVLFLHGGPGGGLHPIYRRYFDPQFYRVILFDQRGCGQSTPHAELRENDTWALVSDIEKIRERLGIDQWVVFGGSWGSTLALSYAVTHPERVLGLILRGIFLCRKWEIHWFYQDGASHIYPDAWENYLKPIAPEEREDLVRAFYRRLISEDEQVRLEAARAWSVWEAATSKLYQDQKAMQDFENPQRALAFARIECHYFVNAAFMPSDTYLLEKARTIQHIPTRIVQGRYDIVCPIQTAWELSKAMPQAELRIIQDAGHSMTEPGTMRELLQATEDFKTLYAA
jgi:proline iminopeptidase